MARGVIYRIVNTATGKCYLGSTTNFTQRIRCHFRELRAGKHHSMYLQRSWNKWGDDYFTYEILYETDSVLDDEQAELNHLQAQWDQTYNVSPVAGGGDIYSSHPEKDRIRRDISRKKRKMLRSMTDQQKKDKWGKDGASNSNWRGGTSKLAYLCPICKGSKGFSSATCESCKRRSGWKRSSHRVRISIDGVEYTSYAAASRATGVAPSTIKDRCKYPGDKFENWRIINEAVSRLSERHQRKRPREK